MAHTLIIIGKAHQVRKAFLDISRTEAIDRYCAFYKVTPSELADDDVPVVTVTFDDHFDLVMGNVLVP